jgi:DNA-binding transcriptional LysR family regulator
MMVSVGMGWTVLPRSMLEDGLVELKINKVALRRELGYIMHEHHEPGSAAAAFIKALQQAAGKT